MAFDLVGETVVQAILEAELGFRIWWGKFNIKVFT
jgi:hypothetical protein